MGWLLAGHMDVVTYNKEEILISMKHIYKFITFHI